MTESHNKSSCAPQLDHLQAGLLLLMEQYAEVPCCGVAMAVACQLEKILRHPLIELFPEVRKQCARVLNRWRARTQCDPAGDAHPPHALH